MGNSIEMAVADFGAQAVGAQVAPLNPNLTDRELTPLFGDIAPTVVLCAPEYAERMHRPGGPSRKRSGRDRRRRRARCLGLGRRSDVPAARSAPRS